jgi:hypothetical protein
MVRRQLDRQSSAVPEVEPKCSIGGLFDDPVEAPPDEGTGRGHGERVGGPAASVEPTDGLPYPRNTDVEGDG